MRTFDRRIEFDPRSRQYPLTAVLPKKRRSYTWKVSKVLDQGSEGACVGFSWTGDRIARPKADTSLTDADARSLYKQAQTLDEYPGEDYEGSSVLGGAKAVLLDKGIKSYHWAFSTDDVIIALGYSPGVLGLNWYTGMMQPDGKGFVAPTGEIAGGHAILVNGVNLKQEYVTLTNSWGEDWGIRGTCKMKFADLDKVLHDDGEFCIGVK